MRDLWLRRCLALLLICSWASADRLPAYQSEQIITITPQLNKEFTIPVPEQFLTIHRRQITSQTNQLPCTLSTIPIPKQILETYHYNDYVSPLQGKSSWQVQIVSSAHSSDHTLYVLLSNGTLILFNISNSKNRDPRIFIYSQLVVVKSYALTTYNPTDWVQYELYCQYNTLYGLLDGQLYQVEWFKDNSSYKFNPINNQQEIVAIKQAKGLLIITYKSVVKIMRSDSKKQILIDNAEILDIDVWGNTIYLLERNTGVIIVKMDDKFQTVLNMTTYPLEDCHNAVLIRAYNYTLLIVYKQHTRQVISELQLVDSKLFNIRYHREFWHVKDIVMSPFYAVISENSQTTIIEHSIISPRSSQPMPNYRNVYNRIVEIFPTQSVSDAQDISYWLVLQDQVQWIVINTTQRLFREDLVCRTVVDGDTVMRIQYEGICVARSIQFQCQTGVTYIVRTEGHNTSAFDIIFTVIYCCSLVGLAVVAYCVRRNKQIVLQQILDKAKERQQNMKPEQQSSIISNPKEAVEIED